ncbi:hypothetical protein K438DRAFT_686093 [Mycena galopus ATCC 62051]|nr:hypothetical protein K438DRAFT_686093 [Mycena galopus ATCC 62051]
MTQCRRFGNQEWWWWAVAAWAAGRRSCCILHIRLVDFDYVTLSSLNRHATAALADVGMPKVQCVVRALHSAKLLEGADWVVDAINNIGTKVDLLRYCVEHDIKVFSSMGAGAKSDPTESRLWILRIRCTTPSRAVRTRLRKLGIASGMPVMYSTEVPAVGLLPLPEEEFAKGKEQVRELGVLDEFRVRTLPVLGAFPFSYSLLPSLPSLSLSLSRSRSPLLSPLSSLLSPLSSLLSSLFSLPTYTNLPVLFGLHTATYVLCALAGKPIANPLPVKNRRKLSLHSGAELADLTKVCRCLWSSADPPQQGLPRFA